MHAKWYLAVAVVVGLSACKQVINHGPVGGADVVVTELRTGEEVYRVDNGTATPDSIIANEGQQAFDATPDLVNLRRIGAHNFPAEGSFDDEAFYVLAFVGGRDFDVDRDQVVDGNTGTQVQGTLRSIVTGEMLNTNYGLTVSPLTESAYRFIDEYIDELTDEEVQQVLDELASELVGQGDPVAYVNVHITNRYYNLDRTNTSQQANVDALADAISTGEAESMLNLLSGNFYSTNAPNVVAEKRYVTDIEGIIATGSCASSSCHQQGGSAARISDNVLLPTSDPDYVSFNTQNFRDLVRSDGVQYILDKATRRISHGGGQRINPGSQSESDFEAWLNLL